MTKYKPFSVNLCGACIDELADYLHTTVQELKHLGVLEVNPAFCENLNPLWLEECGECEFEDLPTTLKAELIKKLKSFVRQHTS